MPAKRPKKPPTPPPRLTGVVLRGSESTLRIRPPDGNPAFTLHTTGEVALSISPGQHVELEITKRWKLRGVDRAKGDVLRVWTDIPALGVERLRLQDYGPYDLAEMHDPIEPPDPYAELWSTLAATPRNAYEFEGIAWGAGLGGDPDADDDHPVSDAAETMATDPDRAFEMLMDVVARDLRCIDAHVHLGNLEFPDKPEWALPHYEVAVAIGELSLGDDFDGLLPWGCLYNRPFLRALHGYGLCRWRLGDAREAEAVFERLLSLNPPDNQGVRFCLQDVRDGKAWVEEA